MAGKLCCAVVAFFLPSHLSGCCCCCSCCLFPCSSDTHPAATIILWLALLTKSPFGGGVDPKRSAIHQRFYEMFGSVFTKLHRLDSFDAPALETHEALANMCRHLGGT